MKRFLVCLLLCSLLLLGCSEPALPSAEEAPYKITWKGGYDASGTVYCDNYELGSSVIIDGYWEYGVIEIFTPGYYYKDKLLILDASKVVIEERVAK